LEFVSPAYTGVMSPAAFSNLALQLEESLAREERLKSDIARIVERSAEELGRTLHAMASAEDQIRPELERWMMSYYDIESRLFT
jgi:hypothetical protein